MPKNYKPTTSSRRHMQGYDFSNLSDIAPLKSHKHGYKKAYGRNQQGRITGGHQGRGGGAKQLYRQIDFKQNKFDIPGVVAPQELKVGDTIINSEQGSLRPGNRMKLKNIPQGSLVHNIEFHPNQGGKMVRSAGSAASVLASEGGYVQLVMPSSETRLVSGECYASIGQLSNAEHSSISLGKAGRTRWLGRRPR